MRCADVRAIDRFGPKGPVLSLIGSDQAVSVLKSEAL